MKQIAAAALVCVWLLLFMGNAGIAALAAQEAGDGAEAAGQTEDTLPQGNVYLDMDTVHIYENMKNSYSEGYMPVVENDTVHLVVPFSASGNLRGERLTVELAMPENAPFVYANYKKEVKKETYFFETAVETYLFQCDIALEKVRKNGIYPVLVSAAGYTESGALVKKVYRIFITIADGISSAVPANPQNPTQPQDPPQNPTQPQDPTQNPTQPQDPTQDPTQPQDPQEPSTEEPEQPITSEPEQPQEPAEPSSEAPTEQPAKDPLAVPSDAGISGGGFSDGGSYGAGTSETEKIYHQPRLILESNSLSGQRILAGKEKEFLTVFENTSESDSIYNLKVTLKPADNSISLVTSSFYFSRVYPQETISMETTAAAGTDAVSGKQTVTFSFEYENEKGTVYNASEDVILEIYQPAQAVLGGFTIASKVYSQETIDAGLQVRNTGKSDIYNVKVELKAEGLFATEAVQAGTLEAGASFDGSVRIYVGNKNMKSISQFDGEAGEDAYGQTAGKLILTYEDAYGEVYTQTQEFTTVIEKPQMVELEVEKEEAETNEWYGAVLVLVTLLFILILCVMELRLRKSKNRLADLLAKKERRHE